MADIPLRDANATKARLLAAAASEFAAFGIAGARVDRIAAAAQANKAQIYHYYGSKDELFDAVFVALVATVVRDVPMDAAQLPEYAGLLFDGYEQFPDIARLATWQRLERGGAGAIRVQAIVDSNTVKIAAIEEAQRAGTVSRRYEANVLLGLIMHAAALWSSQTPEYSDLVAPISAEQRRSIVVATVSQFVS